jgi:tRNA dimethylallyltransferase
VLHTGQYTKRQATWFRHHALTRPGTDPSLTHIIHARMTDQTQFQESDAPEIFAFVDSAR